MVRHQPRVGAASSRITTSTPSHTTAGSMESSLQTFGIVRQVSAQQTCEQATHFNHQRAAKSIVPSHSVLHERPMHQIHVAGADNDTALQYGLVGLVQGKQEEWRPPNSA